MAKIDNMCYWMYESDYDAINMFITESAQSLARLRSGVVELARLTDDDRAGTDNEDFLYVVATGHLGVSLGERNFEIFSRASSASVAPVERAESSSTRSGGTGGPANAP